MGKRNFLIEGVSGAGKTTLCSKLNRRGYHAVHGDRELRPEASDARQRLFPEDQEVSEADLALIIHNNATWDVGKVMTHLGNKLVDMSFLCGGFRNHADLLPLFDEVFVLEIDRDTLMNRLSMRSEDEFGGRPAEKELIKRLHATKEDMPKGATVIDATLPINVVADDILRRCETLRN